MRMNLAGQKFGLLTATETTELRSDRRYWLCDCDCGGSKYVRADHLTAEKITSCGCTKSEICSKVNTHHGYSKRGAVSPTFLVWMDMKKRCTNPNSKSYQDYGGRGISICHRWGLFENFLEDMGERPEGMSIDRIDPDGNYEPSNCKWATRQEQALNKRNSFKLYVDGIRVGRDAFMKAINISRNRFEKFFAPVARTIDVHYCTNKAGA
jgi:hypothetical protein